MKVKTEEIFNFFDQGVKFWWLHGPDFSSKSQKFICHAKKYGDMGSEYHYRQ